MDNLKKVVEMVTASAVFQEFIKTAPKSYLASFFKMDNDAPWQIDFYNPLNDTMTSFLYGNEIRLLQRESKIFKDPGATVEELKISQVKVPLKKALQILDNLMKTKYNNQQVNKKLIILQTQKKPIWNISYITPALNIINARIDARRGFIVEESNKTALSSI